MGSLSGHYSRQARGGKRLALLQLASEDRGERRPCHRNLAARDRYAAGDRLFADINHPDASVRIQMCQPHRTFP